MDIEVDRMNGFDIINEICREKSSPQIIFVTGYNKYAVEAFKTNALGYLLKPVDKEDLIKAVERFTSGRKLNFSRRNYGSLSAIIQERSALTQPLDLIWCIPEISSIA